jgi:F0F1-type ATP synthase assembly protein I
VPAPDTSLGWSDLLGMGLVVAAAVAAGIGLGLVVDAVAGTAPVFLLVGLLLGVIGAVGYTVSKFRQHLKT